MTRSRPSRRGPLAAFGLAVATLFATLGCEPGPPQLNIELSGNQIVPVVFPADVERVTLTGNFQSRFTVIDLGGGTWELTLLGSDEAAVDVTQRNPGFVVVEWACQGFVDCEAPGPTSEPFGLVANDPPIRFARVPNDQASIGLQFDRVDADPVVVFRGGFWVALADPPSCDDVEAAGSIDPWLTDAETACNVSAFGASFTGDWRCGGLYEGDSGLPGDLPDDVVEVQCE